MIANNSNAIIDSIVTTFNTNKDDAVRQADRLLRSGHIRRASDRIRLIDMVRDGARDGTRSAVVHAGMIYLSVNDLTPAERMTLLDAVEEGLTYEPDISDDVSRQILKNVRDIDSDDRQRILSIRARARAYHPN